MQPKLVSSLIFSIVLTLFCACSDEKGVQPTTLILSKSDSGKYLPANPYRPLDVSPVDISYFPDSFPIFNMKPDYTEDFPVLRVTYGRPHRKGRLVFGHESNAICQYGKPWRLGANEATEIEFFKNVSISGKNIPQGRYIIYCIPYKDKWDVILNKNLFSWGLHIDSTKDIFKTEIPVIRQSPPIEDFTMVFQPSPTGAQLLMTWDSVKTILPIDFAK